jgi:aryl-alcohol dehydrogenase-like predicted oxidoreductase
MRHLPAESGLPFCEHEDMRYRQLGESGINASVVGFGAWAIGGWMWGGTDQNEAVRAVQAALDDGVNLIDTAPAYGLGLSEEIVGRAIAGRREEVVLATKCGLVWHTNRGMRFFEEHGHPVHRYLGPESIRLEVERSLRRLATDRIDLYQTHWQDPGTPIADTMGTLLDLMKEGKIRAIGVSNIALNELEEYRRSGPVHTDQERYSLLDREHETALIPYCRDHSIAVLAYSPLANGLLTGKIGPDRQFAPGDLRRDNPRFSVESRMRIAQALERLRPIAEHHGLTMGQLALAWTVAQPGVTHALAGARNTQQARENARAAEVELSLDELREIGRAFESRKAGGGD